MAPTARAQRTRDKKAIFYCKNKMKGALPGIPGKASFIFNGKNLRLSMPDFQYFG